MEIRAFFESYAREKLKLEHQISILKEPTPSSVDAFFNGLRRIAVEVKFSEAQFGHCSRPELTLKDKNFQRDHCDGNYTIQRGRTERCSLSAVGVGYWKFVPRLFSWRVDQDHRPCPLYHSCQLVRNVLAACVRDDEVLDTETTHALVVYDARNPASQPGGNADAQCRATAGALQNRSLLRRVSWQSFAAHIAQFRDLDWLTDGLRRKYGIRAEDAAAGSSFHTNSHTP